MKIDKQKVKLHYRNHLRDAYKEFDQLNYEEKGGAIENARMYYNYLIQNGISYARLALDVVENKGKFGQLANIHFNAQSIFAGIKIEYVATVREKVIISLAYRDAKMRSKKQYNEDDLCYAKIEEYHEKEFGKLTIPYAWGGLAMKELIGSGSWIEYYEGGEKSFELIVPILQKSSRPYNGKYSKEWMLQSVYHSFKVFNFGANGVFEPMISAASKEQVANIWKLDSSRVIEIPQDESLFDSPMVRVKVFKILPADRFVAKIGDDNKSSSDSEDEKEEIGLLKANQLVNERARELFSDPAKLKAHQQEVISTTLYELEQNEQFLPNIKQSAIGFTQEHQEFLSQILSGNSDSNQEILASIEQAEQARQEVVPQLSEAIQMFANQSKPKVQNGSREEEPDKPNEDLDWVNGLVAQSMTSLHDFQQDPAMQEFITSLMGGLKFDQDNQQL